MLWELWWLVASRLTDPARGALSDDVDDASAYNCQLGEYRGSRRFDNGPLSIGSDAILCFAWTVLSLWRVTTSATQIPFAIAARLFKSVCHNNHSTPTVHRHKSLLQCITTRGYFQAYVYQKMTWQGMGVSLRHCQGARGEERWHYGCR